MTSTYEFRIAGTISAELLGTFGPIQTRRDEHETVLLLQASDEAELYGIIARCETLGLGLVGFHRLHCEERPAG
ncbi:MAG: hypothetical protein L0H41_07180 [Microlunatus sp.]|nr:hypothetical protein [Microlunatus sp.]